MNSLRPTNEKRLCSECHLWLPCHKFGSAEWGWSKKEKYRWCTKCKRTSTLPVHEARYIAMFLHDYEPPMDDDDFEMSIDYEDDDGVSELPDVSEQ